MAKGEDSMSDFLDQWVIHDGKPITARLLSTLKRCHISTAHKEMSTFYDDMSKRDPETTPFTSWILKGPFKAVPKAAIDSQTSIDSMDVDEDDNGKAPLLRESLLLVTQDKLKETEAKFERIMVKQVYSFSPRLPAKHTEAHKVAAISQLTTIQHDLHTNKEFIDAWESTGRGAELGTIQSVEKWGDSGQPNLGPSSTAAGPSKPMVPAPIVKKEPAKEVKKEEKKSMGKPVKKEKGLKFAKAKEVPKSKRKLVESDEEEVESVKEAEKMEEEDDEDEDIGPIGYAMEASEGHDDESTKGGKAVRKRADAGDKLSKDEEKRRRQKQELMDMMDEDDDDAGNADPPAIKPAETATTSMMKGTVDSAEGSKEGEEERASTTPGPKKRVRKQRKVIKKVKTKDSKGYTKTQDVEEYESYSSDESDTPAAPAPAKIATKKPLLKDAPPMVKTNSGSGTSSGAGNAASKKSTTAAAAGGQRKLASFFSKK